MKPSPFECFSSRKVQLLARPLLALLLVILRTEQQNFILFCRCFHPFYGGADRRKKKSRVVRQCQNRCVGSAIGHYNSLECPKLHSHFVHRTLICPKASARIFFAILLLNSYTLLQLYFLFCIFVSFFLLNVKKVNGIAATGSANRPKYLLYEFCRSHEHRSQTRQVIGRSSSDFLQLLFCCVFFISHFFCLLITYVRC